jgi:HSP20 family protein
MKNINAITTWSPIGGLDKIGRSFLSLFPNASPTFGWGETGGACDWAPEVDVVENDKEYTLTADLPEVRKEDVHVSLQNGALAIYGERAPREQGESLVYHRSERAYGKFGRTFYLPENAMGEKAKAEFRDGALSVHIPKTEETAVDRREIPIAA